MKRGFFAAVVLGAIGLAAVAQGSAHHSFSATYFEGQTTKIEGDLVQFPFPNAGTPLVLTTDSRGEGSLDYNYESPSIARGYKFDVRMRLVDDENAPTSEVPSGNPTR